MMAVLLRYVRLTWLLIIAALVVGCGGMEYSRVTAHTVSDALANLHRSQAPAADWEGFKPGSSVTLRQVGRSTIAGTFNETVTQVMTARSAAALNFEMVLEDGERNPWLPASTEVEELAAKNATRGDEEDLFIGQNRLHAEVYEFHYFLLGRQYWEKYWLAAGAPDGVARHLEDVEYDPTYTSHTDMKVTDLNIALKAGTMTVQGYCFETEEGFRGGRIKRGRMCKSNQVPGAVVTGEVTEFDGAREEQHSRATVETFKAIR